MTHSQSWTLLLVDDHEADRYRYRRLLELDPIYTYCIYEAETAEEARTCWQTIALDIIILDYSLPEKNGLQVLQEILAYTNDVACIMLTGVGNETVAVEAMKRGAYDYIIKSVALDHTFSITVQKTIEQVRLRRQIAAQQQIVQQTNQQLRDMLAIQARSEAYATCLADIGSMLYGIQTNLEVLGAVLQRIGDTIGSDWTVFVMLVDQTKQWDANLFLMTTPRDHDQAKFIAENYATNPMVHHHLAALFRPSGKIDHVQLAHIEAAFAPASRISLHPLQTVRWCYGLLGLAHPQNAVMDNALDQTFFQEMLLRLTIALEHRSLYLEAQQAVTDREAFLSIASHELKNPLAGLLGRAQLLQRRIKRAAPMEQLHDDVDRILEQGNRLNILLTELLDLSRLAEGQLEIQVQPVDIGQLLDDVATAIQSTTTRHRLILQRTIDPLVIDGDPRRLEQALVNLLNNAVKYSPDGGTITIQATHSPTELAIAIQDQGIGIPQNAIPHLFNRFYRVASDRQHMIVGSGIGLYVVKEIIIAHHGSITVESSEGAGTTFRIRLPMKNLNP